MPTETEGKVMIKGRFGDIQVAADSKDVDIPVPASATHAEIHDYNAFQTYWYSLDGSANSWKAIPPGSRFGSSGPTRIDLQGATDVYLRKPYHPRHIAPLAGRILHKEAVYSGSWDASTNTPALSNAAGGSDRQHYYVTAGGTVDFGAGNIVFAKGDWVYFDAATGEWKKAPYDLREDKADDRIIEVELTFTAD